MLSLLSFFFNDTATTEIYTLSLHDALPIYQWRERGQESAGPRHQQHRHSCLCGELRFPQRLRRGPDDRCSDRDGANLDRKSTRLNSSHLVISYAVFCLKKKITTRRR